MSLRDYVEPVLNRLLITRQEQATGQRVKIESFAHQGSKPAG
jgi:hypothetical protein